MVSSVLPHTVLIMVAERSGASTGDSVSVVMVEGSVEVGHVVGSKL